MQNENYMEQLRSRFVDPPIPATLEPAVFIPAMMQAQTAPKHKRKITGLLVAAVLVFVVAGGAMSGLFRGFSARKATEDMLMSESASTSEQALPMEAEELDNNAVVDETAEQELEPMFGAGESDASTDGAQPPQAAVESAEAAEGSLTADEGISPLGWIIRVVLAGVILALFSGGFSWFKFRNKKDGSQ